MRALRIVAPHEAQVHELEAPPSEPAGLLVRAEHTAISTGTELRQYRDVKVAGHNDRFPRANGYCFAGQVEGVGQGVEGFSVGDRVIVRNGPHDELITTTTDRLVLLGPDMDTGHACFGHVFFVAMHALRRGSPMLGDRVAVVGLGVIGLATVALAKAWGLKTIGIDPAEPRQAVAHALGCDLVLDPGAPDLEDQVSELCEGEGVDLAVEAAASWQAVRTGYQIVRPGGTVVVVARHTAQPDVNFIEDDLMKKEVIFTTSYGSNAERWTWSRSVRLALELMVTGRLDVSPIVTDVVSPEAIPTVYERLDRGDTTMAGIVVDWSLGR